MRLAAVFCALAGVAAAQGTATVDGVVVNKVTGAGIEGATVWFWSGDSNSSKVITNEAGIFHFSGLTPGDYNYRVEKSGYASPGPAFDLLADPPKRHLEAGSEPVRLRIELIPPAALRGRVIGADGNPARATVEIGPRRGVSTDAKGSFAFESLAPGSYTLLARPVVMEHVSKKDEIRTEPVPTYYPSVLDRSLAETIIVRPGTDLTGYEIRLQSAEVHRVRGIVLDRDGIPSAKATVELHAKLLVDAGLTINGFLGHRRMYTFGKAPVGGQSDEEPVVTAADGVFEFPSVRSGEWMTQARSDWIRDEIQHRNILRVGSVAFRVEREDPDELKIQFATPFNLSLPTAIVLSDGSAPAPGVSLNVSVFSETGGGRTVKIEPGGLLQLKDIIPGSYQIRADVEAGNYYVDSIFLGPVNVTGRNSELTPIPLPLKVVLKPAGTVLGTIDEADSGTVVLFPPNLRGVGYSIQIAGRAFDLDGIPPGEYYAIALDRFDPTMTDALLSGLMPRATSVRVEPGSSVSVQLKVNHVPE